MKTTTIRLTEKTAMRIEELQDGDRVPMEMTGAPTFIALAMDGEGLAARLALCVDPEAARLIAQTFRAALHLTRVQDVLVQMFHPGARPNPETISALHAVGLEGIAVLSEWEDAFKAANILRAERLQVARTKASGAVA